MDLIQAQKVNQLAKELRAHNIASSSEEALQKASALVGRNTTDSVSARSVTEDHANIFTSNIRELQAAVNHLLKKQEMIQTEIANLKNEIKKVAVARPLPIKKTVIQNPLESSRQPAEADVSIEKIFYYGQK